jgi:hypothetical protein
MTIKTRRVSARQSSTAAGKLIEMMAMRHVPQSLHAAAVLGIADLLADGSKTSDELAQATETHSPSLYRVLRTLAAAGILAEDTVNRFRLTVLGQPLRSEAADSVRSICILWGGDSNLEGRLVDCLRSGRTAVELISGSKNWVEYHQQNPAGAGVFNAAMTALSNAHYRGVLDAYSFAPIRKLVDVGGGHGRLISMILSAYPTMHGVLFDLPHAFEGGQKAIAEAGLGDRCEVESGDFFQSVPEGADAYVLSRVIHDWDNDRALSILKVVRKAMAPSGRLLLFEAMIKAGNQLSYALLSDLNMMIRTGGGERSEIEYRALYKAAGFKLSKVIATQSPTGITIIEGKPD